MRLLRLAWLGRVFVTQGVWGKAFEGILAKTGASRIVGVAFKTESGLPVERQCSCCVLLGWGGCLCPMACEGKRLKDFWQRRAHPEFACCLQDQDLIFRSSVNALVVSCLVGAGVCDPWRVKGSV